MDEKPVLAPVAVRLSLAPGVVVAPLGACIEVGLAGAGITESAIQKGLRIGSAGAIDGVRA